MNTVKKIRLSYRDLPVDPQDTASMLGYDGRMPDDIREMVAEVMDEVADCYDIRGTYQIFDRITFEKDEYRIRINETDFRPRKIVFHQLHRSSQIAVFVCTAGAGIERRSKQMMANNDPLKGFIADILGSVVVEAAIDLIQQSLSNETRAAGLKITNRYSPGYCGWPTEEQHKLFALLPGSHCGVRLTESALMQPAKSVSGFIGVGPEVRFHPYTCQLCDAMFCVYRNKKATAVAAKQRTPVAD